MKNGTIKLSYHKYVGIVEHSNIIDSKLESYNVKIENLVVWFINIIEDFSNGVDLKKDFELIKEFLLKYIEINNDHIYEIEKEFNKFQENNLIMGLGDCDIYVDIEDIQNSLANIKDYNTTCIDYKKFLDFKEERKIKIMAEFIEHFYS